MNTFADHPAARSIRMVGKRKPWWLLAAMAVVALVVGGLGGWAVADATKANPAPAAEPVARQLVTLLETAHGNRDIVDRAAALYAKNAIATDVPSGERASGREQIAAGWNYIIGQGGAWRVDQVLANDEWAVAVVTRTRDSQGRKVSAPWVLLLKVQNGLIVSESDIYDEPYPF